MKLMERVKSELAGVAGNGEEGTITKAIERETAKIPSGAYLSLGIVAGAAALGLMATGRQRASTFVGLWVPTILILGLYNKIVKVEGSD